VRAVAHGFPLGDGGIEISGQFQNPPLFIIEQVFLFRRKVVEAKKFKEIQGRFSACNASENRC